MPTLSTIVTAAAFIAVVAVLVFVPEIWGKARERWPGVFETDNPEPEQMPAGYMIGFILAVIGIVLAGVWYGPLAVVIAFYVAFFIGVILIHVPAYIRHQYRRLRGRTPPRLPC